MKAGEHGSPIVFWKWLSREIEKPDGSIDEKHFPMLRYYTVFNAEQTEGCRLPADTRDGAMPEPTFNTIEACEAIYANMPNRPRLEHGATTAITRGHRLEAYYTAGTDTVVMPRREAFDSPEFYYSVLFHELTHSTGAVHRLNRPTLNQAVKFGDTNYSKEELVAEMGASFLAGHTGIEQVTLTNNAAYLASWIKALKGDAKLVIVAAAAAQKASRLHPEPAVRDCARNRLRSSRVNQFPPAAALPKRLLLGNAVWSNYRRSKANGRNYSPSPSIEMGKAAKPTAYPPAQSGEPRARISDPRRS